MNFLFGNRSSGLVYSPANDIGSSGNFGSQLTLNKLSSILQQVVADDADLMATFILEDASFRSAASTTQSHLVAKFKSFLYSKTSAQQIVSEILTANNVAFEQDERQVLNHFMLDAPLTTSVLEGLNDATAEKAGASASWDLISSLYSDYDVAEKSFESTRALLGITQSKLIEDTELVKEEVPPATNDFPVLLVVSNEETPTPSADFETISADPPTTPQASTTEEERSSRIIADNPAMGWAIKVAKYNPIAELLAQGLTVKEMAQQLSRSEEIIKANLNNVLSSAERSGHFDGFAGKTRSGKLEVLKLAFRFLFIAGESVKPDQVVPAVRSTPQENPNSSIVNVKSAALVEPTIGKNNIPKIVLDGFTLDCETLQVENDIEISSSERGDLSAEDLNAALGLMNGLHLEKVLTFNYIGKTAEDVAEKLTRCFGLTSIGAIDSNKKSDRGIRLGASLRFIIFGGEFQDHFNTVRELFLKLESADPSPSRRAEISKNLLGNGTGKPAKPKRSTWKGTFDPVEQESIKQARYEPKSRIFD